MRAKRQEVFAAYLFLAPFLITLVLFFLYATVRAVYFSFTDYDLFNAPRWVGLQNYVNLFREENFLFALRNSLVFAAVVVIALLSAGLVGLVRVLEHLITPWRFQ